MQQENKTKFEKKKKGQHFKINRDFPGGPVVKTFNTGVLGSIHGQRTQCLNQRSLMLQLRPGEDKKKKKKKNQSVQNTPCLVV